MFKIAPDGSTYAVLYNFCSLASCADGSEPIGGVIIDANHNLYGTTELGGTKNLSVVFALTPSSGSEWVLYSFCNQTNCLDGSTPAIGLTFDASGNLYGATTYGGAMNDGIVYKLTGTGFVPPGTAALVP